MTPTRPATPDVAAAYAAQGRWQRFSIVLLIAVLSVTLLYSQAEGARADHWRTRALEQEALQRATILNPAPLDSAYYPATLIGKDGSQTKLDGKAILINLGSKRTVYLALDRTRNNYLTVWAPSRKEDDYFNRVVYRASCANLFQLDLEKIKIKSTGATQPVAYDLPATDTP